MLDGEWRSQEDGVDMGASRSIFASVCMTLRKAGYTLESEPAGPNGMRRYRVASSPSANGRVGREVDGVTYPRLGATLTVRALVLGDDGELVVQLTDGHGGAWSAHVTGHVG
jgi:hypothetical protein